MDTVLSVISIEWFKILSIAIAAIVGVGLWLTFRSKWQWAIVGAVATYAAATASVGIYVIMHINDPRWALGGKSLVEAPSFSETPVFGQHLVPLDGFLDNTAATINEITAFRHAIPVANEFFNNAGWAFLALLPLFVVAIIVTVLQKSNEKANLCRDILKELRAEMHEELRSNGLKVRADNTEER